MPYLVPIASSAPEPGNDLLTHATAAVEDRGRGLARLVRCASSTRSLELEHVVAGQRLDDQQQDERDHRRHCEPGELLTEVPRRGGSGPSCVRRREATSAAAPARRSSSRAAMSSGTRRPTPTAGFVLGTCAQATSRPVTATATTAPAMSRDRWLALRAQRNSTGALKKRDSGQYDGRPTGLVLGGRDLPGSAGRGDGDHRGTDRAEGGCCGQCGLLPTTPGCWELAVQSGELCLEVDPCDRAEPLPGQLGAVEVAVEQFADFVVPVLECGLAVARVPPYLGGVDGVPAGVGGEDGVDGVEQYVAVRVAPGWCVGVGRWCGQVAGEADQAGDLGDADRWYAVPGEKLLGQPGG